jgi:hypothetical protein
MNTTVIIYRIISGIMGGMIGSFFMFLIYGANLYFLQGANTPLSVYLLIFMVFIGSLIANLLYGVFISLAHPEKYSNQSNMLWQVFIVNIFIFIVVFPFYILIKDVRLIALFHLIFSALASNIIYEIFAKNGAYILTGIYGSFFGVIIIFVITYLIETTLFESLLVFIILPTLWCILTISTLFTEYMYSIVYKITNTPFLDINHKF